jgi:hypothetical protein
MAETTVLEQLTGVRLTDAAQVLLLGAGFAAVIIAAQILFWAHRAIRRTIHNRATHRSARPDMIVTVIGAGIVLALSVEGMWEFFSAIGMDGIARAVFCAVFEICLIAVALRSRHVRLSRQARKDALIELRAKQSDEGSATETLDAQIASIRLRGLNDLLVWVFAALIGTLAALEAPTRPEQIFRFIVPFIAAIMWELALGADVEDQRVTATAAHWIDRVKAGFAAAVRFFVSIAVKFGWVPPTSADATEQYREKRMTQLVNVSHHIHTVDGVEAAKLLSKQRRLILDLQARGQWTTETLTELSERLDVIYRAVELTAPAVVRPAGAARPKPPPTTPVAPAVVKPAPQKPAPKASPRHAARKATAIEKHHALLRAWQKLRNDLGTDQPPCRDLATTATELAPDGVSVGKSLAAKWLKNKSWTTDTDNGHGQEQAA